jgi:hypothetical protein
MPAQISSETKAAILAHYQYGLSSRKIRDKLAEVGTLVSHNTVARVIAEKKRELEGSAKPPKRLGTQNTPTVRTKEAIEKVRKLVDRPDPYSLRSIVKKTQISYSTVRRIISQDLDMMKRMKTKTHALSNKMVDQRVLKGPRLLEWIKGNKWKNIVTIDEAWVYMSHVNGHRKIFYQRRGKESPQSFQKYWRQKHPKGVMFVAGISSVGRTAIRFVPPRTKVNSWYYVNKVLKPLFRKDIPKLFGSRAHLVVLHQDSAPAHKATATVQWLKANGYKFIPAEDWPANSPDLSPMDYAINGIFKQRLWKRKARNLRGLIRVMKEEWKNISKNLCVRTLQSWKGRVIKMVKNHGYQIEYLK